MAKNVLKLLDNRVLPQTKVGSLGGWPKVVAKNVLKLLDNRVLPQIVIGEIWDKL